MQVHRELTWLYAETGARITTCVGGMDPRRERYVPRAGRAHRGRHAGPPLRSPRARRARARAASKPSCSTKPTRCSTWASARTSSACSTAAPAERRTLMFSATIPKEIATLAKKYQKNALRIATTSEGDRHRDIEYRRRFTIISARARPRRRQPASLSRRAAARSCSATRATASPTSPRTSASAASRSPRSPASSRSASATRRSRRCAMAARACAWRPTSPRAVSTCPTSAS